MFPDPPKLDYATPPARPRSKANLVSRVSHGVFGVIAGLVALAFLLALLMQFDELLQSKRHASVEGCAITGAIGLILTGLSIRWCRFAIKGRRE